ncbi:MAG: type II toxin-antitoxin system YafQ family toxin [Bacteroidaceae bacterium]|nr:type II toxin-antitoxin system YafQ family toxin [Bacteroidaceae bacterium]
MKKIYPSTQFKKDYKRYRNNPKLVEALGKVIDMLANEQVVPQENRPHLLKGEYKGCMECHIGGDFLLIWVSGDVIELVRLGSHSELFK